MTNPESENLIPKEEEKIKRDFTQKVKEVKKRIKHILDFYINKRNLNSLNDIQNELKNFSDELRAEYGNDNINNSELYHALIGSTINKEKSFERQRIQIDEKLEEKIFNFLKNMKEKYVPQKRNFKDESK
ncbi:MAG: hypothetical protein ACTSRZ_21470 [Promethearchaeota archaeon]